MFWIACLRDNLSHCFSKVQFKQDGHWTREFQFPQNLGRFNLSEAKKLFLKTLFSLFFIHETLASRNLSQLIWAKDSFPWNFVSTVFWSMKCLSLFPFPLRKYRVEIKWRFSWIMQIAILHCCFWKRKFLAQQNNSNDFHPLFPHFSFYPPVPTIHPRSRSASLSSAQSANESKKNILLLRISNFLAPIYSCCYVQNLQYFIFLIFSMHTSVSTIYNSFMIFLSAQSENESKKETKFPLKMFHFQISVGNKKFCFPFHLSTWQSRWQVSPTSQQLAFNGSLVRFLHIWTSYIVVDG